jgi:hypothetical protein
MSSHEDKVSNEVTDADAMRFAFEMGLRGEYHFSHFFSVHAAVGGTVALLNRASQVPMVASRDGRNLVASGGDTGDVDGSVLGFGFGDALGTMGFTFWFH